MAVKVGAQHSENGDGGIPDKCVDLAPRARDRAESDEDVDWLTQSEESYLKSALALVLIKQRLQHSKGAAEGNASRKRSARALDSQQEQEPSRDGDAPETSGTFVESMFPGDLRKTGRQKLTTSHMLQSSASSKHVHSMMRVAIAMASTALASHQAESETNGGQPTTTGGHDEVCNNRPRVEHHHHHHHLDAEHESQTPRGRSMAIPAPDVDENHGFMGWLKFPPAWDGIVSHLAGQLDCYMREKQQENRGGDNSDGRGVVDVGDVGIGVGKHSSSDDAQRGLPVRAGDDHHVGTMGKKPNVVRIDNSNDNSIGDRNDTNDDINSTNINKNPSFATGNTHIHSPNNHDSKISDADGNAGAQLEEGDPENVIDASVQEIHGWILQSMLASQVPASVAAVHMGMLQAHHAASLTQSRTNVDSTGTRGTNGNSETPSPPSALHPRYHSQDAHHHQHSRYGQYEYSQCSQPSQFNQESFFDPQFNDSQHHDIYNGFIPHGSNDQNDGFAKDGTAIGPYPPEGLLAYTHFGVVTELIHSIYHGTATFHSNNEQHDGPATGWMSSAPTEVPTEAPRTATTVAKSRHRATSMAVSSSQFHWLLACCLEWLDFIVTHAAPPLRESLAFRLGNLVVPISPSHLSDEGDRFGMDTNHERMHDSATQDEDGVLHHAAPSQASKYARIVPNSRLHEGDADAAQWNGAGELVDTNDGMGEHHGDFCGATSVVSPGGGGHHLDDDTKQLVRVALFRMLPAHD